jgi:predicted dehydrogenase
MPGERRARIALIGAGWWATYAHLPSLTSYPRAEVVALADPTPERLSQAAEAFGVERTYGDYRTMLERERLDGVVVATPHATHAAIARDVLEHDLALMLEKPMVLRAREARQLRELAAARHLPLVVGYPYHFIPQHHTLRQRIADGVLGQLQLVDSLFASMVLEYYRANPQAYQAAFNWSVTGPLPTTYSEPDIAGGGQAHLQMTHSVALLLWLTDLQPTEVFALMERFDVRVDLVDALSVRFEGGTLGSLASTGAISAPQSGHQQLEYRLYGSQGYALLDAMAGTCTIFGNDGAVEELLPTPAAQLYPKELTSRHLVDILLDGVPNQSPAEIGVRTVELLEAAYRSAAEHRPVRVSEL